MNDVIPEKKPALNQEKVKRLFTYDFRSGILTRKGKEHKCPIYAEKVWINFKNGQKKQYPVSQIIWCYMTGDWEKYVMRINKDPLDNRWSNFRIRTPIGFTVNGVQYTGLRK